MYKLGLGNNVEYQGAEKQMKKKNGLPINAVGTTYQVVLTYQCGGQLHVRECPCMHVLWIRGDSRRPPDHVVL